VLIAVDQLTMPVTAHILSLSIEQVRQHFQRAHVLVSDHIRELNATETGRQINVSKRQGIVEQEACDVQLIDNLKHSKTA